MFKLNGSQQQPKLMPKVAVSKTRGNLLRTRLLDLPQSVRVVSLLMLLLLVLLLVACATPSTTPTEPARNPQAPQLSEPLPQESYLHKAQKLIESWQNAVTGM